VDESSAGSSPSERPAGRTRGRRGLAAARGWSAGPRLDGIVDPTIPVGSSASSGPGMGFSPGPLLGWLGIARALAARPARRARLRGVNWESWTVRLRGGAPDGRFCSLPPFEPPMALRRACVVAATRALRDLRTSAYDERRAECGRPARWPSTPRSPLRDVDRSTSPLPACARRFARGAGDVVTENDGGRCRDARAAGDLPASASCSLPARITRSNTRSAARPWTRWWPWRSPCRVCWPRE
jgi:hypothetical protein